MQANHVWVCGCVLQRCTFRVICNRPANCWLLSVVKLCLYGMCFAKVYVPGFSYLCLCIRSDLEILPTMPLAFAVCKRITCGFADLFCKGVRSG